MFTYLLKTELGEGARRGNTAALLMSQQMGSSCLSRTGKHSFTANADTLIMY